jgi:GH15 family glucan-1,4-alpha-glucosidase
MSYKPIESYGLIGDLHTTALVGSDGSIDWFCFPRFDSPSVFAAILDDKKGGSFHIHPIETGDLTNKQLYWPDTNVLITRFLAESGVGETVDFMPIGDGARELGVNPIVRQVTVTRGRMKFRMVCQPAFNFARDSHQVEIIDTGARFLSKGLHMTLNTRLPLTASNGAVTCEFELEENQSVVFTLAGLQGNDYPPAISREHADQFFKETVNYWRTWLKQCTYKGRWRESVMRSALVLKLLTYEPTGAIVAAPTCSLPEGVGGGQAGHPRADDRGQERQGKEPQRRRRGPPHDLRLNGSPR